MDTSVQLNAQASENTFATRLRGFGPLGLLAIVIIFLGNIILVPLSALFVLLWRHLSQTRWSEIGFVRPQSWVRTVTVGTLFGIAFKFVMKSILMPLLGANPVNQAYHYLAGNKAAIPMTLYALVIGAGFGEETVFRGFLFERLGKLLGAGVYAKVLIVVLTSIFFGVLHYLNQGVAGVEQAIIVGLVFGSIFAITGRIFMLMIAHAAFDLTAYAIIYWGFETKVAHLIFT